MRMNWKMSLLFGGSLLSLALLASWSFSRLFHREHMEQIRTHLLVEGRAAQKLAETEVERWAQQLLLVLSEEKALRTQTGAEVNRAFMKSDFVEIALMKKSASGWIPDWVSVRPGYASKWPENYAVQMLSSLPWEKVESGVHVFHRIQTPDGQSLFAMMIPVGGPDSQSIGVGVFSVSGFSRVMDPFRRSGKEAGLVDSQGYALAYTRQQYAGASLAHHPVVESTLKSREFSVLHQGSNLKGESALFSFENLNNSNLLVFVSEVPHSYVSVASRSFWQTLLYALALTLAGVGILIWWKRNAPELETSATLTSAAPVSEMPAPDPGQEEKQRYKAYKQLGAGLGQALKGPMSAILGHAQLARSKSQDEAVKEHIVVIEREARKSRDTLENLLKLTGEAAVEKKSLLVTDVLQVCLDQMKPEFSKAGVQVKKTFEVEHPVLVNPQQLETVFEEVLRNGLEAMALTTRKELEVKAWEEDGRCHVEISDTGEGMEDAVLSQAFDPFYTQDFNGEKEGLGLTVVKGLMNSMGGQVQLNSVPGEGCHVRMDLPLAKSSESAQSEDFPTAPAEDEITFIGETQPTPVFREGSVHDIELAQTGSDIEIQHGFGDYRIEIRKPKVRTKN